MLTCEGYRMFFGVMQVRTSRFDAAPQDLTFKRITGNWLYKPDCECWYCLGHSYPAEVCQVIYDKTPMTDSLV